eukprot:14456787-Alexandrium_andersonii.AAC.1
MSGRLRAAIAGFQLATLDDSVAEGPHTYVSRAVKVRAAARPCAWSYFLRVEQNAAAMHRLDSVEPGAIAKLFT